MSYDKRELTVQVIDQYMTGVELMMSGHLGVLGYPAALLLLCASDAIGHIIMPYNKNKKTRLDVFTHEIFNRCLTHSQAENLKDWFRIPLAHTGGLIPRVYLDEDGNLFEFDSAQALRVVRVRPLYALVKAAWAGIDKFTFLPGTVHDKPLPDPAAHIPMGTLGPTASGMP